MKLILILMIMLLSKIKCDNDIKDFEPKSDFFNLTINESVIEMITPTGLLFKCINDTSHKYDITKYHIRVIYDDNYDIDIISKYFPKQAEYVEYSEIMTSVKDFRKMRNPKKSTFIVLSSCININKMADLINSAGLFSSSYTWIFATKDLGEIICVTCKHSVLNIIQPTLDNPYELSYVNSSLNDAPKHDLVDYLFYDDIVKMVKNQGHRLDQFLNHSIGRFGEYVINNKGKGYQDIVFRLYKINYLNDKRTTVNHASWFYHGSGGIIMSRSFKEEYEDDIPSGYLSKSCLLESENRTRLRWCDDDINKRSGKDNYLRFIVHHHPPFVFIQFKNLTSNSTMVQHSTNKIKYVYQGFMIDMLHEIIARYENKTGLKFPHHTIETASSYLDGCDRESEDQRRSTCGFGIMNVRKSSAKDASDDDDKRFYGMVNEVRCDERKIALMPMTITLNRQLAVSFSEPFFDSVTLSVMAKKPTYESDYWMFVSVLETSVWIFIIVAFFGTATVIWILDKFSPDSYQNDPHSYVDDEEHRIFTFNESLWFCYLSLTPQGGGESPKALSGQLIAISWWLFGFIMIASYAANICAHLTLNRIEYPVNNFDQLLNQHKLKFSTLDGSSTRAYYERMAVMEETMYKTWKDMTIGNLSTKEDKYKMAVWEYPIPNHATKVWKQMVEAEFPRGYDEAIHKVRSSTKNHKLGYALVAESPMIDYAVGRHCDLMKIGNDILPRTNAIMFNKNQKPLMDDMSQIIHDMKEDGKMDELRIKWWFKKNPPKRCPRESKPTNSVKMKNFAAVFILLAVGVIFTIIMLHLENMYYTLLAKERARVFKEKVLAELQVEETKPQPIVV